MPAFPDVEEVRDHKNTEDHALAKDQAEHAHASAVPIPHIDRLYS